jgi:micrococcal nuclease
MILEQGRAAAQFAQKLLPRGSAVRIEYDSERRDHYGRLLAYLWLPDGDMANETIIRSGYAYPLTIPPNVRYRDRFIKYFNEARSSKRGLWAR